MTIKVLKASKALHIVAETLKKHNAVALQALGTKTILALVFENRGVFMKLLFNSIDKKHISSEIATGKRVDCSFKNELTSMCLATISSLLDR